ncbi:hypothetical protein COOONC_17648 [Cooperia oncophora]
MAQKKGDTLDPADANVAMLLDFMTDELSEAEADEDCGPREPVSEEESEDSEESDIDDADCVPSKPLLIDAEGTRDFRKDRSDPVRIIVLDMDYERNVAKQSAVRRRSQMTDQRDGTPTHIRKFECRPTSSLE